MANSTFTARNGIVIQYYMRNGKKVDITIQERATASSPLQIISIDGTDYSQIYADLSYRQGQWECSISHAITSTPNKSTSYFYNILTTQQRQSVTGFILSSWNDFITTQRMIEADVEKEKREINYYTGKIKQHRDRIEKMELLVNKANNRLQKHKSRLNLLQKSSAPALPQTPQPTIMVQTTTPNNP